MTRREESRRRFLQARGEILSGLDFSPEKRAAEKAAIARARASRDQDAVDCDGCGGSGASKARKGTACPTCGGDGWLTLAETRKRNPEKAAQYEARHHAHTRRFKPPAKKSRSKKR